MFLLCLTVIDRVSMNFLSLSLTVLTLFPACFRTGVLPESYLSPGPSGITCETIIDESEDEEEEAALKALEQK